MIADRVLEGVSAIFALHCDPKLEVGRLGVRVGAITAASDLVEVHLTGPGGHTARPHLTADLVYAVGRVVTDLPAALSRLVDTRAALNITFGAIEAGTVHNAIPTAAVARGTLRVLDRAVWGEAQKLVERILEATVAPYTQVSYRLDYQRGAPPVVNDEEATAVFATAARTAIGDEAVLNAPRAWAGRTSPGTWRRSPAPWPAWASASPAPTSTSTPPPSTWTSAPSPWACASWSRRPCRPSTTTAPASPREAVCAPCRRAE